MQFPFACSVWFCTRQINFASSSRNKKSSILIRVKKSQHLYFTLYWCITKNAELTAEEIIFKATFLSEWHYNDSNLIAGSIHAKEDREHSVKWILI